MSKPELYKTYRCAQKGDRIEGETTSTAVHLEDKDFAVCVAVVCQRRVHDRSNGKEDRLRKGG